jgi:hypothetical protein
MDALRRIQAAPTVRQAREIATEALNKELHEPSHTANNLRLHPRGGGGRDRCARMETALRAVREAIVRADPFVLTDTLWVSDIETAVDCIAAALDVMG